MNKELTWLLVVMAMGGLIAPGLLHGSDSASHAHADLQKGSASKKKPHARGTGDASKISQGNQQNNAAYNQLIGTADTKSSKAQVKTQTHHSAAVAATAADIKAGAALRDSKGVQIGTIVAVDASQAVVDTGQTKIGVPLIAFGKDDQGLLLGMTADKFAELVAKAQASH